MTLFAEAATSAGSLAPAVILGALGVFFLLPRPQHRVVSLGVFLALAGAVHAAFVLTDLFGAPGADRVESALFWLFGGGAVVFAGTLVAQRNPARGAIAFAFVILSTCGLFLLLAAPFLMAATVIVYAGAIIVTSLFVLMLSNVSGPSDENDRTREPLLGTLAGFAFAGLVLFSLHQSKLAAAPPPPADPKAPREVESPLPAATLTYPERVAMRDVADRLKLATESVHDAAAGPQAGQKWLDALEETRSRLADVVGTSDRDDGTIKSGSLPPRVRVRADGQAKGVLRRAAEIQDESFRLRSVAERTLMAPKPNPDAVTPAVRKLREDVLLLCGSGELPARNVGNLGLLLYADHLLAVELAGTLLLVATVGAVAIANRKGIGQ
jgi:NADH:ubiquinone oxidoreductase subunit 6 (subunit J)